MGLTRVAAVVLVALGCASHPRAGGVTVDTDVEVVALETDCGQEESDPIEVVGAEVRGSTLSLEVIHEGGCTLHGYRVCGARVVLDTEPAHWIVTVLRDGRGDDCRERQRRRLEVEVDQREMVGVANVSGRSATIFVR
jgi:hypothetical protein